MAKCGTRKASAMRCAGNFVLYLGGALAALALSLVLAGVHPLAALLTTNMVLSSGIHGFYGLGLLTGERLGVNPVGYVPIGYWNSLKLKILYTARFHMRDNFLWEEWLDSIHADIVEDFEARGVPKDDNAVHEIPTYEWGSIDGPTFYAKHVRMGRPGIIRNVPLKAMSWTPKELARRAGDFVADNRCLDGSVKTRSLAEYVADTREDVEDKDRCYFDNNQKVFVAHPELEEDLEMWRFAEYMQPGVAPLPANATTGPRPSMYMFSQLFMTVRNGLGALYHAANYNNLFLMMHGEKKWTFVDPSNSFLCYPLLNSLMRDSKSFVNWHVTHNPNSTEMIKDMFPLFRYAPKYVFTLRKGDVMLNPPWNWHMVDNPGKESIGVATRWRFSQTYPYTNALFSFLQVTAPDFWQFLYNKLVERLTGEIRPWGATSHLSLDEQMNFGRTGSIYARRNTWTRRILSDAQWERYESFILGRDK